jgi:very-short-patch-repair endonuclease
MTVVTSFEPSDLDPDSVTAEGAKAFARFVRYAASRGADRAAPGSSRPLNPFEISVRDRLVAAGLDVMAHWGVAGYYLDFAARHPARPDQMALAIEADGPSYYAAETSRARDRLRREHLERLGWRFHRIWSTEWFADPDRALAGVLTSYQQALATSDAEPEPEAENEPQAEVPAPIPARSGPRPAVVAGAPIAQHAEAALMALLEWIESDGVLRTNEELLREASRELGYARIGAQIRARLTAAIARLRSKAR